MPINFTRRLPIPMEIKELYPVSKETAALKEKADGEIRAVMTGESAKKLLVIGPCSADREDTVLEYCSFLSGIASRVGDKIIIIARVFTNKPRTSGTGYMGMLSQPDPGKAPDPFEGLLATRRLHLRVLSETKLPTADEMLYPADYRYLSDLLSYVTVGARSTENQEHRLVASGLDVPVGMKNPLSGSLDVTAASVYAAHQPHAFIYRGWAVDTPGNPLSHAVLRGYSGEHGVSLPNCNAASIKKLKAKLELAGVFGPSAVIDASHGNSRKDPFRQASVIDEVTDAMAADGEIKAFVRGFMAESYLLDGSDPSGKTPGMSITDPCLGKDKTEELIYGLYKKL